MTASRDWAEVRVVEWAQEVSCGAVASAVQYSAVWCSSLQQRTLVVRMICSVCPFLVLASLFLSFRDLVGLGSLFLSLSALSLSLFSVSALPLLSNETTTANYRQAIPPTPRLYTSTSLSPLNSTAVEQPCRPLNNPDNRNPLYPSVPRQEELRRTG